MTRSKILAIVFYLGAALAGAAVGVAAERVSVRTPSGPTDPHSFRNRLFDQLHLNAAQRDSATVLYDERDLKLQAVMDKYKASLDPWRAEQDSLFSEYRQRLSKLLTREQQAIWDQMRREREKAQRTEKK